MAGALHGELGGIPIQMIWEATPEPDHLDEDCLTKPASHFRVIGQGTAG